MECPKCDGTGDLYDQGPDGYARWRACGKCRGTGEVPEPVEQPEEA